MNVFHLYAEAEQNKIGGAQTWLVVADSLFEALSLIPEWAAVRSAEVQIAAVTGPSRIIACFEAPSLMSTPSPRHRFNKFRLPAEGRSTSRH